MAICGRIHHYHKWSVMQKTFTCHVVIIVITYIESTRLANNCDIFVEKRGMWEDEHLLLHFSIIVHYCDVIMGEMASQITSLTIVYSTVYSDTDQRKHQSSSSLAFVRGIHRGPVNSPHKWPVTRKMFPFDDVIMYVTHHASWSNESVILAISFFNQQCILGNCISILWMYSIYNSLRTSVPWIQHKAIICKTTAMILTHWGRVTQICVSKLTIIGSDNGLWPGRRQAII